MMKIGALRLSHRAQVDEAATLSANRSLVNGRSSYIRMRAEPVPATLS